MLRENKRFRVDRILFYMTQETISPELQKQLGALWKEMVHVIIYVSLDNPEYKDIKRHLMQMERNYSNNIMSLVDNHLAYQK